MMKPGDQRAPLFIVHGLGGKVDELAPIAQLIETDRAVYGIEAQGVCGDQLPLTSVADMARRYADAICAFQPSGPYFLCGFSYGGIVALEMARLLRAESKQVALLFLIDSYAHPKTWPAAERFGLKRRILFNRVRLVFKRGVGGTARDIAERSSERKAGKVESSGLRPRSRRWPGAAESFLPITLQRVHEAGTLALENYAPQVYPGRIDFLTTQTPDIVNPRRAKKILRRLAASFKLYVVPGTHLALLEENAGLVASCISRRLANPTGR
jgi:acetoacetyl-CoA synthetase